MAESNSPSESPPPTGVSTTEARTNRDSIKKGFSDIVKFADVSFTRAKQYVTEKAGKADEVTEYDEDFETLSKQMDQIKLMTERVLVHMESLLQPNPNIRLEQWARAKLDRPKSRPSVYSSLGNEFSNVSEIFEEGSAYRAYLQTCAQVENRIAESKKKFDDKVTKDVITPLKAFLEVDVKTITRERKFLNVKRLDLDARKASCRKAQGDKLQVAEIAQREAQVEYDLQLKKVRKSLEKLVESHTRNMGYVRSFMLAQKTFHAECMTSLEAIEGTGSVSPVGKPESTGFLSSGENRKFVAGGVELDREDSRKARMLYDYDAVNTGEISINSGETFTATAIPGDGEYVMAEYKGEAGKVPSTYIEYI